MKTNPNTRVRKDDIRNGSRNQARKKAGSPSVPEQKSGEAAISDPASLQTFRSWLGTVPKARSEHLAHELFNAQVGNESVDPVKFRAAAVAANDELLNAINQAQALTALMENKILNSDDAGSYCDSIQCGIVELNANTFSRLYRASEGAFATKGGAR